MRSSLALASLCLLCAPGFAWGHANLLDPTPRNLEANKTGPCGVPRTATPTTLAPGATITVKWEETIDHPGHYRLAWSPSADTGFDTNIIADNIPDVQGGTLPHMYQQDITLPATPCTDCTLQLIQVMTETTPPSNYYSCADIVLAVDAPDAGPTAPDASPGAPDAGQAAPDAAAAGEEFGDAPGLCSTGGGRASAVSALLVALALLAARRRR